MKLDPKIGRSLKKASPTILTCIGAAGVVATAVLAVKATPKADSLIKADSRRNHDGDPYAATKLEAVKSCWKCYIPRGVLPALEPLQLSVLVDLYPELQHHRSRVGELPLEFVDLVVSPLPVVLGAEALQPLHHYPRKASTLFTGMGYWTRANAEICLLATRGHPKRANAGVHQVILSHIEEHSKKPRRAAGCRWR